ncbi:hypothetical protein [Kitasatospora sp. NPDC085879]|uniref:hypothetical protein n=1 Tax=Kitasatospora sp. NPDC085879 TaxID=3154769 RepID=UPI000BB0DECC|nr:hypothetical protein [Streptomyces sp. TLI_235]PBC66142.1 hypothetical protein BX265_8538 [Streptomyces sp. TLI_235]
MRTIARRMAVAAAALIAVGGGITFSTATPAVAGGWGCSGSEVSDSPFAVKAYGGQVLSHVHLFWDSSTGRNCAVNVKAGSLYGTAGFISIRLIECREDTPGSSSDCTSIENRPDGSDNYRYYAGPVSVPGSGHCIWVEGITSGPSAIGYYTSPTFHC